jgi:outer membrane receptor protein involved in Fe transport
VKGGPLNGWGLGLGVNTVDGSRIIPLTGSRRSIPGYVVWDGALSRTLWGWKLGANVRNLFNRYYYITGNAFMFTRGYPTQYSLSASRSF